MYPEAPKEEIYERRVSFDATKAQAKSLNIGDAVTVVVSGEVCGISKYGTAEKDTFSIEVKLKKPPKIEANKADASVRSLIGEKAPSGRHKNEADKSIDDIFEGRERSY